MNGSRLLLHRGGNRLRFLSQRGGDRLDGVNGFRDAPAAAIRLLDRLGRTLDASARRRVHRRLVIASEELLTVGVRDMCRIGIAENLVRACKRVVHGVSARTRILQIGDRRLVHRHGADAIKILLKQARDIGIDELCSLCAVRLHLLRGSRHRAVKVHADADEKRHGADQHEDDDHLGLYAGIVQYMFQEVLRFFQISLRMELYAGIVQHVFQDPFQTVRMETRAAKPPSCPESKMCFAVSYSIIIYDDNKNVTCNISS